MNILFRKLDLPQPPRIDADVLIKLAEGKDNDALNPPMLPNGVPKTNIASRSNIDEIIQDIEDGNSENITILEWVHCLYQKNKWDTLNPEKSKLTSEAIWKLAEQNTWLKQKLFWNLVLSYDGKKALALSLVESYRIFLPQSSRDTKILSIIEIFNTSYPEILLTEFCLQSLSTPSELFLQHQLPTKIAIIEKCLSQVVSLFLEITKKSSEQVDWLLKCLEQMRSTQQIKAVEELLITANPKLGAKHPKLIDWLRQYYGSTAPKSRWNELLPEAKIAMRKWLGAVSYQDFQRLVSLILERVHLVEHEHKRLKSRSGFWSNYSNRFERIRILLPQSSVNILGSYLDHQDVEILQEDGSDPTEVCIFDFGDWFVVEFFRGNGSETLLFARDAKTEQQLFNSQLSIKKLRCLGLNKPIHDHVFCWQYYCERWLKQHNILPNQGTTHFKGVPARYSKYNEKIGLVEPSSENIRKRNRSLEYWKLDIAKLKMDAIGYC